ncbi:MAG: hypothetical protein ACK417_05685 [Bacteroidia bacterium]
MRKLLFTMLLAFGCSTTFAQEAPHQSAEKRAEIKQKRMAVRYALTEEQQSALQPELIRTEQNIQDKRMAVQQAQTEVHNAQLEQHEAILEVLNPEQQEAFKTDQEQRKNKRFSERNKKSSEKKTGKPNQ